MKKKIQKGTFDVEYLEFTSDAKSKARTVADNWILYFECLPSSSPMRNRLIAELESEIKTAIEKGDASFFRKFAKFIEAPKTPCPIREWLFAIHMDGEGAWIATFTQAELVAAAKDKGFFKGRDDESILTQLKRTMKYMNFQWKNSPRK